MNKAEIEKKLQELAQEYAKVCSRIGDAYYKAEMMKLKAEEEIGIAKGLDKQAAELHARLQELQKNESADKSEAPKAE